MGVSESMTLRDQGIGYFVCFCVLKCTGQFEIKQPIEYTSSCNKNFEG